VADWATVCLLAAPRVQLSVTAAVDRRIRSLRYQCLMPPSCQFRDYKALLVVNLTHVNGAIQVS